MEKKNRRGLPCPGRPKKIKGSGLVSGRSGRRHLPPAAFLAARFAPRSPQSLAAPSRGAKSSQKFRAAACHRRPFQRRDLLPAPRKALRHRSGEQNLHTDSAPQAGAGRLFWGAVCSPLPANPCSSVSRSKIFTLFPRRRPVPGGPEHTPPRAATQKKPSPRQTRGF